MTSKSIYFKVKSASEKLSITGDCGEIYYKIL